MATAEVRHLQATVVFDLEDRWVRDRGVGGPHPRPLGRVRVRLLGEIQAAVRHDYPSPRDLELSVNSDGFHVSFGVARTRGQRLRLPAGSYVVQIVSDLYQEEEVTITIPRPNTPYSLALEPGYAYPFSSGTTIPRSLGPTLLRGQVAAPDGGGIGGATVSSAAALNAYRTDDTGQWVLVFPDSVATGPATVHVALPDGSAVDVPNVQVVAGRDQSLANTALRGIVQTAAGVAVRDAVVTVAGRPGRADCRPDGAWTYVFPLDQVAAVNVTVTATLPDGRTIDQLNVPVQPRSTVVVPTFRFV